MLIIKNAGTNSNGLITTLGTKDLQILCKGDSL